MKKINLIIITSILYVSGFATQISSENTSLTRSDEESLLFMLEEEKLARDVYVVLYGIWGANQFNSISNSEQSHMDSLETLLIEYDIPYTILPSGEFANSDLQNLYNQLIALGSTTLVDAFVVGMTVEDVDIYDLQVRIAETDNQAIIDTYELLLCGSTNHMRAFYNGLTVNGGSYSPQYITIEEYNAILAGSNVQCVLAVDDFVSSPTNVISTNMVKDTFSVVLQNNSTVYIYSTNGSLVRSVEVRENEVININEFSIGVYYVKVINNNKFYFIKILKE